MNIYQNDSLKELRYIFLANTKKFVISELYRIEGNKKKTS